MASLFTIWFIIDLRKNKRRFKIMKNEKTRTRGTNVGALIAALVCVTLLTAVIAGCTSGSNSEDEDVSLSDVVDDLLIDVDVPAYEAITLDEETFSSFAFIPYEEGITAIAADALVNITPHSLVVIRTDNSNGKELADEIIKNADPNKWLCVGSETVNVGYTDNYVVLVMSYKDVAKDIMDNFGGMAIGLDGMEMTLLTADNTIRYE